MSEYNIDLLRAGLRAMIAQTYDGVELIDPPATPDASLVDALFPHCMFEGFFLVGKEPYPASVATKEVDEDDTHESLIVFVASITGVKYSVVAKKTTPILRLKRGVFLQTGIPVSSQRLIMGGQELLNHQKCGSDATVESYDIRNESVLHLVVRHQGPKKLMFDVKHLEPTANGDFRTMDDSGKEFERGNQSYERPIGFFRYALKVLRVFPPNNHWLRCKNDPGEWMVTYHGINVPPEVQKEFFQAGGIYTTQSFTEAEQFATRFTHNGQKYLILIQNRVNQNKMITTLTTPVGSFVLSRSLDDVRPYGILIKKE